MRTNWKRSGEYPFALQPANVLKRKGNYVSQHVANANPDNFYNRALDCWTSDPTCGLDVGPKRPLEDLRQPEKTMFKFQR